MTRTKTRSVSSKKNEPNLNKCEVRETRSLSNLGNSAQCDDCQPLKKSKDYAPDIDASRDNAALDQSENNVIKALKGTIDGLCDRILALEGTVERLIKCSGAMPVNKHVSVETQTEVEKQSSPVFNTNMSYAQVTKSAPATQTLAAAHLGNNNKATKKQEKEIRSDVKSKPSIHDVKIKWQPDMTQKGKKTPSNIPPSQKETSDTGVPHVLILHDSTMNTINPTCLGLSYGLQVATRKAHTSLM